METSAMINELRTEAVTIDKEIKTLTDRYEAIKMAIDALELLASTRVPAKKVADVPVTANTESAQPVRNVKYPGKPKRILQKDPKGIVLREFRSVNAAAKAFGWTYPAMKKYLDTTSHDKQIRLRGFYLAYAA